ncbi:hypothetical protein DFS34DRAFT_409714 [Phlyctochytrium arcticum]|nr:hypothetical protein DFS34DRAFT_409714 [Phlyctochytrium arcticum]
MPRHQMCEYVADNLRQMTHCSVDPNDPVFQPLLELGDLLPSPEESIKFQTKASFIAAKQRGCPHDDGKCKGLLVLKKFKQQAPAFIVAGLWSKYFYSCSEWVHGQTHTYVKVPESHDIEFVKRLIAHESQPRERPPQNAQALTRCSTVLPCSSKQKECFDFHRLDNDEIMAAKVVRKEFLVTFTKITPLDQKAFPFVILLSHGVHTHPPPPPVKIPTDIRSQLQTFLAGTSSSILSVRAIIGGRYLQTWFGRLLESIAADIHLSFNDLLSVRRLTAAESRRRDPFGESVLGVMAEMFTQYQKRDEEDTLYIRKAEYTPSNKMIVLCALERQLLGLKKGGAVLIDMTFKGIRGDFNEWEIAMMERGVAGKNAMVMAAVRIYTDGKDADVYCRVFEMVNTLCRDETGQGLRFRHVHGNVDGCITVVLSDLDPGQYKGLGLFLEKMTADTTKMTWSEHLQHVLKSCKVHFDRNVNKNAPGEARKGLRALMKQIAIADQPATLGALFKQIVVVGAQRGLQLKDWVSLYQQPYIIASLYPAFSKIPRDIWAITMTDTNQIEGMHKDQNRNFMAGSLLHCI